jgi:hypothetical protein
VVLALHLRPRRAGCVGGWLSQQRWCVRGPPGGSGAKRAAGAPRCRPSGSSSPGSSSRPTWRKISPSSSSILRCAFSLPAEGAGRQGRERGGGFGAQRCAQAGLAEGRHSQSSSRWRRCGACTAAQASTARAARRWRQQPAAAACSRRLTEHGGHVLADVADEQQVDLEGAQPLDKLVDLPAVGGVARGGGSVCWRRRVWRLTGALAGSSSSSSARTAQSPAACCIPGCHRRAAARETLPAVTSTAAAPPWGPAVSFAASTSSTAPTHHGHTAPRPLPRVLPTRPPLPTQPPPTHLSQDRCGISYRSASSSFCSDSNSVRP